MDNLNNIFAVYRLAAIDLRKQSYDLYECPTCHRPYNLIHTNERESICLNCGRTYFKDNPKGEIFEGMGVFLVVKDDKFTIGAIPKDHFEESCKSVVRMSQKSFHEHPNKCDYFILHQYKDGIVKNIDFKDML